MKTCEIKKGDHCCQLMAKFLDDPRVGIHYIATHRFYYIDLLDKGAFQGIYYCPFCGYKLPPDLWSEYFKILEKEYKIEDPGDKEQIKNLPEEFKSDKWWKDKNIKPKYKKLNLDALKVNDTQRCCKLMSFFLEEQRVAIYYNPIYREYFIRLWSYPNGKHVIYACPWCGFKFKTSLIDEYFNILTEEYKIGYAYYEDRYVEHTEEECEEKDANLPDEFKSDQWCKKRNL